MTKFNVGMAVMTVGLILVFFGICTILMQIGIVIGAIGAGLVLLNYPEYLLKMAWRSKIILLFIFFSGIVAAIFLAATLTLPGC